MFSVFAVEGIPEIQPGMDLGELIGSALSSTGLHHGDILVISSKIVSKAEGRIVQANDREQAITDETVRVVATRECPRGITRIVENHLGIVGAAAGVDASNTPDGTVLLLPLDPDASAARIRAALEDRFEIAIGVVISDTLGRPWREGQTDVAIGGSGGRARLGRRSRETQGRRPAGRGHPRSRPPGRSGCAGRPCADSPVGYRHVPSRYG
jgi:coenzyme F420-0:L-glutamate ligase/coenzyme F420-1:gamma-L-glutamate ligase